MCQTPACWMQCVIVDQDASSWLPSASLASLSITDHADRAWQTSFQACLHAQAGKWSLPVLLGPLTVDRREEHSLWWAESAVAIWLCPVEGCYGKKRERGRGRKNSRRPLHLTFTALLSLSPVYIHSITAHDGVSLCSEVCVHWCGFGFSRQAAERVFLLTSHLTGKRSSERSALPHY